MRRRTSASEIRIVETSKVDEQKKIECKDGSCCSTVFIPVSIPESRVEYLNIVISEKGLSELSRGKCIVFVPREQIQTVEVRFGSRAENPMVQAIFGAALVGLGFIGLYLLIKSGFVGLRLGLGFILFGCVGVFCLYEVLKKGYYLYVISSSDTRKLVIKGVVQERDLQNLINSSSQIGYNFQSRLNCNI